MDVIEAQEKWSRVRVLRNGEVKGEGWVLNYYLTDRIPYKIQVDSLMNENKKLKEKLAPVNKQMDETAKQRENLSILYQQSQEELHKLKGEFDSLKNASCLLPMFSMSRNSARFPYCATFIRSSRS